MPCGNEREWETTGRSEQPTKARTIRLSAWIDSTWMLHVEPGAERILVELTAPTLGIHQPTMDQQCPPLISHLHVSETF